MVHALNEAWRILVPDGTLLDLRPRSAKYPIELVTPAERFHIGHLDGYGMESVDLAADVAMRTPVEDGWFTRLKDTNFDIEFYWDTVNELQSYVQDESRITSVAPSYAELEKAYVQLSKRTSNVRLCYRRPTILAVYRKAEARPVHSAMGTNTSATTIGAKPPETN